VAGAPTRGGGGGAGAGPLWFGGGGARVGRRGGGGVAGAAAQRVTARRSARARRRRREARSPPSPIAPLTARGANQGPPWAGGGRARPLSPARAARAQSSAHPLPHRRRRGGGVGRLVVRHRGSKRGRTVQSGKNEGRGAATTPLPLFAAAAPPRARGRRRSHASESAPLPRHAPLPPPHAALTPSLLNAGAARRPPGRGRAAAPGRGRGRSGTRAGGGTRHGAPAARPRPLLLGHWPLVRLPPGRLRDPGRAGAPRARAWRRACGARRARRRRRRGTVQGGHRDGRRQGSGHDGEGGRERGREAAARARAEGGEGGVRDRDRPRRAPPSPQAPASLRLIGDRGESDDYVLGAGQGRGG